MKYRVVNRSNLDMDKFRPLLKSFLPFVRQNMGFGRPVSIIFVSDPENAENMLGKTAHYDPNQESVSIYTDKRHPKDILRSLSHELVHHTQNCRGDLSNQPAVGADYFQHNEYMQEMEREAYEKGNMVFRDWEEKYKKQLQESIYYTGVPKMKRIDSRRSKLNNLLMERFGYKKNKDEGISHLCATLVTERSTGRVGHPINHTLLEDGTVTHYDVEFDDVIIEGMPVRVLEVEVQQEHMHAEDREDYEHGDKPRKTYTEEEEEDSLEEGGAAARTGNEDRDTGRDRMSADRIREELEEDKMPDKNKDGIPDYAQDGKGKNDLGKAKGAGDSDDDSDEDSKKDKDLSKVPPQLRKHVAKKQTNETEIREAIRRALRGT